MEKLKKKIKDTALRLFQTEGIGFTLDTIANNLHISKKTIYKAFENKEELLLSMLDDAYQRIYAEKDRIMQSDLDFIEKLKKMMIAMPEEYLTFDFRHIEKLKNQYPRVYQRLDEYLNSRWDSTIQLIQEGIQKGEIKDIDIPTFQQIFTSSIEGFLLTDFISKNHKTYDEALHILIEYLVEGIRKV